MSDELASDFRRVRDDFRSLNRDLRERIVDNDGSRGDVLEAVFADVDLIADSDAGKTFRAFWRLLTDPQQSGELEAALEAVLDRDFAGRLSRRERRDLSGLTGTLLTRGGEVHDVLYQFARGLKQFVQSREYREQRRMSTLGSTSAPWKSTSPRCSPPTARSPWPSCSPSTPPSRASAPSSATWPSACATASSPRARSG